MVLPAPFGPISAWIDPAATRMLTSRSACRPPNARDTFSSCKCRAGNSRQGHRRLVVARIGCVSVAPCGLPRRVEQTHDAVGQEIEREQDEQAVDDEPELVEIVQHLGQQRKHGGADHRPHQGAGAAEQHGEQKEHRAEELEIVGADVVLLVGEQRAAESGEGRADDEDETLRR